jgi:hypothetical protein
MFIDQVIIMKKTDHVLPDGNGRTGRTWKDVVIFPL